MSTVLVDAYDGLGIHAYWEDNAECDIASHKGILMVTGNYEFMQSLIQQFVYFASNDFCLPAGSHIHYDNSMGPGYGGIELVLEVMPAQNTDVYIDTVESLNVHIGTPASMEELCKHWTVETVVEVAHNSDGAYVIGNRYGFLFLAQALLFLVENVEGICQINCATPLLSGWRGSPVQFMLT